jgi:hypothetical protein
MLWAMQAELPVPQYEGGGYLAQCVQIVAGVWWGAGRKRMEAPFGVRSSPNRILTDC